VIQKLALVRDGTVHCGKEEVQWNDFKDAISLLAFGTTAFLMTAINIWQNGHYLRNVAHVGAAWRGAGAGGSLEAEGA